MKSYLTYFVSIFLAVALSHADSNSVEKRSELFLGKLTNKRLIKSGTPYLLRLLSEETAEGKAFKAAYINAGRPSRDLFTDSELGHFRVHYDTTGVDAPDMKDSDMNGVPDFVDSTLVYLEYAWENVIALGYDTPKSDKLLGGSSAVDCYIDDLSNQQMYGYTSFDNGNGIAGTYSSYLIVDNNFTDTIYQTIGFDALRMTTAHEFFHVIHLSYYGEYSASWWMEQTSVWFENYIWDDINDYLYYIYALFENRDIPIDTYNGSFEYGAAMFAIYIAEQYGSDTLRLIWNTFRDKQSGDIELLDPLLPGGLAQNLSDFSVWLYFTGYRANTKDFFSESDIVNDIVSSEKIIHIVPAADTLEFKHYTFKYIEIKPENGFAANDTLLIEFTDFDGGLWINRVILYNSPDDYSVEQINWQQPSIVVEKAFDKAVLVITNTSKGLSTYSYAYNADIVSSLRVDDTPAPSPYVLHPNYPNPFNPSTTISFSLPRNENVSVSVFNSSGQKVEDLFDGYMTAGEKRIFWKPSQLAGGVYFVAVTTSLGTKTTKMLLLK